MSCIPLDENDYEKILENIRIPVKSKNIADTNPVTNASLEYYPCLDGDCCAGIIGICVRDELGRRNTTR